MRNKILINANQIGYLVFETDSDNRKSVEIYFKDNLSCVLRKDTDVHFFGEHYPTMVDLEITNFLIK